MVALTGTVGDGGANAKHDVAIVQLMLRLVKSAKHVPYYTGNYSGNYDQTLKTALGHFQKDQSLTFSAPEKSGLMSAGGATLSKLNAALPAKYADMRIIAGTNVVYMPARQADVTASVGAISSKGDLEPVFRQKILTVVNAMYSNHKIAMEVVGPGWRRTFAEQASQTNTGAGPGESNHNFGRAVDLGFHEFTWIGVNGAFYKEDGWLNTTLGAKATQLWDARDAIALTQQGLFRTSFGGERVHLQTYNDSHINARKSLALLLTTVGTMKWEFHGNQYNTNLGLGIKSVGVGSSKQIWAGGASVTAAEVVATAAGQTLGALASNALFAKLAVVEKVSKAVAKAAPGSAPPPAAAQALVAKDITAADLKIVRTALKAEFETADTNWQQWVAVP